MEYYYRYEDHLESAGVDEFENSLGFSHVRVVLLKYRVYKYTPKGAWIYRDMWTLEKRFILTSARKRYACPTVEEAKESFIARKNRQIEIYSGRVRQAKQAITAINCAENKLDYSFDKL